MERTATLSKRQFLRRVGVLAVGLPLLASGVTSGAGPPGTPERLDVATSGLPETQASHRDRRRRRRRRRSRRSRRSRSRRRYRSSRYRRSSRRSRFRSSRRSRFDDDFDIDIDRRGGDIEFSSRRGDIDVEIDDGDGDFEFRSRSGGGTRFEADGRDVEVDVGYDVCRIEYERSDDEREFEASRC